MRDFNFFSYQSQEVKESRPLPFYVAIGAAVFIGTISVFSVFTTSRIAAMEKQNEKLISFLNAPQTLKRLAEVEAKKKQVNILKQYSAGIDKIQLDIKSVDWIHQSLLLGISAQLPQNAFLQTLSLELEDVQIQGITSDKNAIAEFQHNLKSTNLFEEVHVSTINRQPETNFYIFELKCTLKDVSKDEIN